MMIVPTGAQPGRCFLVTSLILDDVGAVYEDHLLGASSTIAEHSIFGTIMDRRGRSCLGSAQIVHEAVNCLSLR